MYAQFYAYIALVVNKMFVFSNHKILFMVVKVSTSEEDMFGNKAKLNFSILDPNTSAQW